MIQQGQVFELRRASREQRPLWAYRYRVGGRGSRRVQRGGFTSREDAVAALERDLDRVRRERRVSRSLTLAELVDVYLAQHDVAAGDDRRSCAGCSARRSRSSASGESAS